MPNEIDMLRSRLTLIASLAAMKGGDLLKNGLLHDQMINRLKKTHGQTD